VSVTHATRTCVLFLNQLVLGRLVMWRQGSRVRVRLVSSAHMGGVRSPVVYAARVHVPAAYTRLRLFSRLRGIRDWGHGFWVHRVDKFGRVRAVYIM